MVALVVLVISLSTSVVFVVISLRMGVVFDAFSVLVESVSVMVIAILWKHS